MSSIAIASIVFACLLSSVLLGHCLRGMLPDHHLSRESKDVVNLAMGLIATMAALVLGLLTASAKGSFDVENSGIHQSASNVIQADRVLARYGPETKEIREQIRRVLALRIHQTWPEDYLIPKELDTLEAALPGEGIEDAIRKLSPQTEVQRELQSRALQITRDLQGTRWLMIVQALNPMPTAFLVVLGFWLCILFAGFGLFAPRNATVIMTLVLSAGAVSSSIFLILEMNRPFDGLIKLSSEPLRYALSQLGQ